MKKIIGFLAMAALVASCSTDETTTQVGNLVDDGSVSLVSYSENGTPRSWSVEDQVGLYHFSGETTLQENLRYYNSSYNADYAAFRAEDGVASIYYDASGQAEVIVYYPYSEDASEGLQVDVSDQSLIGENTLLSTGRTTLSKSGGESLVFENVLNYPSLALSFTVDDQSYDMSEVTLTIGGLSVRGIYDILEEVFELDADHSTISGISFERGESQTQIYLLPQNDVTVTVCVSSLSFGYYEQQLTLSTIEAGEIYPFDVTISEDKMTITAGNIADWESGDSVIGDAYDTENNNIAVTSVKLEPATLDMLSGEIATLSATVYPLTATDPSLKWSSDNDDVATVSTNGVVTAVGAGTATITATTNDGGYTATCSVTVTDCVEVGDFLYSDWSFSSSLDSTKQLLGVVYQVDEDLKSGWVVYPWEGVDETGANLAWKSTTSSVNYAINYWGTYTWTHDSLFNAGYGIIAMREVYGQEGGFDGFPAFEWVANLNATAVNYSTTNEETTNVWHMPAEGDFYEVINSNIVTYPIINSNIETAGGTAFKFATSNTPSTTNIMYLTSSEVPHNTSENVTNVRSVGIRASDGYLYGGGYAKTATTTHVRAIMKFELNN